MSLAHIRQSRPEYGLGIYVKVLNTFDVVPSSPQVVRAVRCRVREGAAGSSKRALPCITRELVGMQCSYFEFSRANCYPWSPSPPRWARPGPGPHMQGYGRSVTTRWRLAGQRNESRVVMPTVLPTVGRREHRPVFLEEPHGLPLAIPSA